MSATTNKDLSIDKKQIKIKQDPAIIQNQKFAPKVPEKKYET